MSSQDIQKLKDKLDEVVSSSPLLSEEVLNLSRELDLMIVEYYRQ